MIERITVSLEADDLAVLRMEAQRRGVSLSSVLSEILHEAANQSRSSQPRPKPHFGFFRGAGEVVRDMLDDEAPARGRLQS